jgi:hypothetical protein
VFVAPQQFVYSFGLGDAKTTRKSFGAHMKDEDVEQIFEALDEVYKPLGVERFEEALQIAHAGLLELANRLAKLKDRNDLKLRLQSAPDLDPVLLQEMRQKLPNAVYSLRRLLPDVIKEIPHAPGGRPQLPVQQEPEKICEEIGGLLVKRVPLKVAYKRIGQRHGASARTIQRIWNQRKKEA